MCIIFYDDFISFIQKNPDRTQASDTITDRTGSGDRGLTISTRREHITQLARDTHGDTPDTRAPVSPLTLGVGALGDGMCGDGADGSAAAVYAGVETTSPLRSLVAFR